MTEVVLRPARGEEQGLGPGLHHTGVVVEEQRAELLPNGGAPAHA